MNPPEWSQIEEVFLAAAVLSGHKLGLWLLGEVIGQGGRGLPALFWRRDNAGFQITG